MNDDDDDDDYDTLRQQCVCVCVLLCAELRCVCAFTANEDGYRLATRIAYTCQRIQAHSMVRFVRIRTIINNLVECNPIFSPVLKIAF